MLSENVQVVRKKMDVERILAVSDIHGDLDAFDYLLEKMRYSPERDGLVVIGDLVQRGPKNLGVIRRCMELMKNPNVVVLQGNNDRFVLGSNFERLLLFIGYHKYDTFHGEIARELGRPLPVTEGEMAELSRLAADAYPAEHEFLGSRPHILETEKFLFAHAGLKSEELDRQNMSCTVEQQKFAETGTHVFRKLLLVGHWPVANYRSDCLSNKPLYDPAKNVLSIDGGCGVKPLLGQLNGVILDNRTGEWTWESADHFEKVIAPCSQKPIPASFVVAWPENQVKLLERGERSSLCRIEKTGDVLRIPNSFLGNDRGDGTFNIENITDARLEVEQGECLSLIARLEDSWFVLKNGEAGWLLL